MRASRERNQQYSAAAAGQQQYVYGVLCAEAFQEVLRRQQATSVCTSCTALQAWRCALPGRGSAAEFRKAHELIVQRCKQTLRRRLG
jgi:hypothetical protein